MIFLPKSKKGSSVNFKLPKIKPIWAIPVGGVLILLKGIAAILGAALLAAGVYTLIKSQNKARKQ
ncbi:MAG: hypothetical protein C4584_01310 [Armatimonadetes bacterium]|nr:MAG: hypothetical protein C4584_01310 [Armatimonadota bacterium]